MLGNEGMRKLKIGIIILIISFFIGYAFYKLISDYSRFVSLQNEVRVTWQDDANSCGKPQKSVFGDEWIIIDNPLCSYSSDLNEVSTLELSDFFNNPKLNDGKIIRVEGKYIYNLEDAFKSEFYMHDRKLGQKHFGMGYWDFDIYNKIGNFINSRKVKSNNVDVTLVIQLIDVTDNPAAMENNGNTPFNITILHIEQMK
jgi:hypothetical protein